MEETRMSFALIGIVIAAVVLVGAIVAVVALSLTAKTRKPKD